MAGLLSGLEGLGLGGLENLEIFESKKEAEKQAQEPKKVEEKDLILDRNYECPVCDQTFSAKMVKAGKAKLLGTEPDLRAKYEGIDVVKYDVLLCPYCGYAALSRFYGGLTNTQVKLIKENISQKVQLNVYNDETYSYEQAMERYKLALVNAVVKRSKASEKAYICLKSAWLVRGYQEELNEKGNADAAKLAELKQMEEQYLANAFSGFCDARQAEGFPMCGMDETTVDYLLAVLAVRFKKFDVASRMIAGILASASANARMKDKARDLKEQVLAEMKNAKNK